MKKKARIGVINWDNSLPPDTYFGHHASRVETPEKYRHRVPFYAETGDGKVKFHLKTQKEYDHELSLAIDAGIDYFAYAWYSDERQVNAENSEMPSEVHSSVWELNQARRLHATSVFREKIKMCAVLICLHPFSENDFVKLAAEMKQPYYECVDGRPLVCLFGGYRLDFIKRLRAFPEDFGTEAPFIVFFNNGVSSPDGDYSLADGVSDYACTGTELSDYKSLIDVCISANENRKKYGVKIVPEFTVGWNPSPRIYTPVPWTSYPDTLYPENTTEEEYLTEAKRFADWVKANGNVTSDHFLVFAWNEFEEGGYICPTLTRDGKTDDSHLKAMKKIVGLWKAYL